MAGESSYVERAPMPALARFASPVRGQDADLTPPRPPAYAGDATDLCYVKDCGRAIALLMVTERLNHHLVFFTSPRSREGRNLAVARTRRGGGCGAYLVGPVRVIVPTFG